MTAALVQVTQPKIILPSGFEFSAGDNRQYVSGNDTNQSANGDSSYSRESSSSPDSLAGYFSSDTGSSLPQLEDRRTVISQEIQEIQEVPRRSSYKGGDNPAQVQEELPQIQPPQSKSPTLSSNSEEMEDRAMSRCRSTGSLSFTGSRYTTRASPRDERERGYRDVSRSQPMGRSRLANRNAPTTLKLSGLEGEDLRRITGEYTRVNKPLNVYHRIVLRRKRPLLCDMLQFTPEYQKMYRRYGLLDDQMLANIMVEQTDFGQMYKFIDLLGLRGGTTFDSLCELLMELNLDWLMDEMKADLLVEKGELEVEEYIYREAGMDVHRRLGKSKTVSEWKKKELQALLAIRSQAAKEAWRQQLNKLQTELDAADHECWFGQGRLKSMGEKVNAFMQVQRDRVNPYAHDLYEALSMIREDPDPENKKRDYYTVVEDLLDNLLQLLSRLLFERETMDGERKRCLAILKVTQPVVQMDGILEDALRAAAQEMTKKQREADHSDQMAMNLTSSMSQLQVDTDCKIAAQTRECLYLQTLARQREERIRQLERLLMESTTNLDEQKGEVAKWTKRCEILEKTRRLGYYYPKWQDRQYAMDDIEYDREPVGGKSKAKLVNLGGSNKAESKKTAKTVQSKTQPGMGGRSHTTMPPSSKSVSKPVRHVTPRSAVNGGDESRGESQTGDDDFGMLKRDKTTIMYESSKNAS